MAKMTKIWQHALLFAAMASAWPGLNPAAQQPGGEVFRVKVRLVEVYAAVYDSSGHYVDGLGRDNFEIREDGQLQPIASFEASSYKLSCAILLDTTGSMAPTLPRVKNAVIKLIDSLGPEDAIAIYSFDRQVSMRQEFTTDKAAAKRAVLRLRAEGETALFDAIAQTTQEISSQAGKKALVVFTDGEDNASMINAASAVARAKKLGLPLYTIAEGDAIQSAPLKKMLAELSQASGGLSYEARKSSDIEQIFKDISQDLQHLYLISYKPPAGPGAGVWRRIAVALKNQHEYRIRSKEGYTSD
jgi:Ca-activated chloride channel family protein